MSGFYAVLQWKRCCPSRAKPAAAALTTGNRLESFFKIGTKPQIDVLIAQDGGGAVRYRCCKRRAMQVARTQFCSRWVCRKLVALAKASDVAGAPARSTRWNRCRAGAECRDSGDDPR